ncbi:3-keto-disaccharide hydrolase [Sinomicrobium sp. M5D2P9]
MRIYTMKNGLLACLMALVLSGCNSGKTKLFNGKDLTGWEIYGTEKWYVEDGLLVAESGPDKEYGYLATDKSYRNFELDVEFLQEADGNSGVFFRSEIEGTKISGWQVEVAPPNLYTGGVYESYGRGWLIKPEPEKEKILKYGEWNHMKIKVQDDHVTTWLNGEQMIDFTDDKIGEANGKIALQIHDGGGIKVYWRNLVLKEIPGAD